MVFLDHFAGGAHGGRVLQILNVVRERLWIGVDVFLVLSGFLITGILYDTGNDSRFFRRFFARRSLRIFPVFYLLCALLLLLGPVLGYKFRAAQAWFLVYMGNWVANHDFSLYEIQALKHPAGKAFIGHFWSLCVEEQFYLLWPPLVWFVRDRVRLIRLALGLSAAALLLRWYWLAITPEDPGRWIIRTLPFRIDTLLVGAVLALVLRGPNAAAWQRSCKWVFLACLVGSAVVMFPLDQPGSYLPLTIGLSLVALASVGLIGMALIPGSRTFKLFYWKPIRTLGKYSYGFYLYNAVWGWAWIRVLVHVGEFTHSRVAAGLVALPLNFLATFLVAKLSFDLFEVKFLRWKRHFEYDSEVVAHKHAFLTK